MSMGILPASLAVPRPTNPLFSSLRVLTGGGQLQFRLRPLSIPSFGPLRCPPVRMGGGPRTYPGGVSKWQWKRMQAKKAKQLLKARLLRERQIYEMRKRAELKAAVSELERPWEVVERAPNLFSVSADEQVKALADRFQRPGGFDMWTERDGPQLFRTPDGLPSARFFPKGAVHSIRPYGVVTDGSEGGGKEEVLRFDDWISRGGGGTRRRLKRSSNRGTVVDVEARESIEGSNNQESNGAEEDRRAAEGTDPGQYYRGRGANMASYSSSSNRHVGRRRQGFEDSPSSLDSDVMADAGEESGKMIRRGGYRNGQVKVGKVSLRPTRNLYSANGGGIGARYSTGNRSYSSSSNHLVHRRQQGLQDRPTSLDSNVMADTGEEGKRMIRRGGYHNRQVKVGKVSLRPTTDLYSEDGSSYRARDSAGNGSYSSSSNRDVHRRRQGFEDSPSSLDSYVMANTGEESGKMIRRGGYRNRQVEVGKVLLRPTTDLYSEDGSSYRERDSAGNGRNGFRTNHPRRDCVSMPSNYEPQDEFESPTGPILRRLNRNKDISW